jgi:hypothetical protein
MSLIQKTNTSIKTKENTKLRKFKMHPDLLFSVIKSQAGTQEKAILEAVMNAVDAGASRCDIIIDEKGYNISDNGKGFASKKEIDEFFETFGTPHKDGDATYGRFRMGRGQLFAFSTTIWRTTTFEMNVDIQKFGLNYILKENLPFVTGCTIIGTWYKKLSTQELFVLLKEFENLIKYMQIPVYVNGTNLSVNVEKEKWDYKEEDFFVKINKNGNTLSVYNMGALVSHYPASRFGVAGTIVTKSALKVNFARNDVLTSECPLWKKITKKMKEIMSIETSKKNLLTDAEREAILNSVICKETLLGEVIQKGLLIDISGKKLSFKTIIEAKRITFSTGIHKLKKIEEKINDHKLAIVLSESNLQKFCVKTPQDFIAIINNLIQFNNSKLDTMFENCNRNDWKRRKAIHDMKIYVICNADILDIQELISGINTFYETIEDKFLNKKQRIFLKTVKDINCLISKIVYQHIHNGKYSWSEIKKFERSISLGKSEVADAWTDGKTYITLEVRNLSVHPMKIVHLLVHEYCHNTSTNESHDHSNEFFETYHEILKSNAQYLFEAALKFQKTFNKLMLKEGVKPKKCFDNNLQINKDFMCLKEYEFEDNLQTKLNS